MQAVLVVSSAKARGSVVSEDVAGERRIITTASGLKYTDLSAGSGPPVRFPSMPLDLTFSAYHDQPPWHPCNLPAQKQASNFPPDC